MPAVEEVQEDLLRATLLLNGEWPYRGQGRGRTVAVGRGRDRRGAGCCFIGAD